MAPVPNRSRAWCYTLYDVDVDRWVAEAVYQIEGREVCPHTGNIHQQGFIYFSSARTFVGVSALFPGAHVEPMKTTIKQAVKYCMKDGVYREHGDMPKQGKRSDLEACKAMIDAGESDRAVAAGHFGSWCRYRQSFQAYRLMMDDVDRDWMTECRFFFGPGGCGKTRYVYEAIALMGSNSTFRVSLQRGTELLLDGYKGEEDVVFDDVESFNVPFFKRLIDRYPLKVIVRYTMVNFLAKRVWITSNFSAEHVFGCDPLPREIVRRVEVFDFAYQEFDDFRCDADGVRPIDPID